VIGPRGKGEKKADLGVGMIWEDLSNLSSLTIENLAPDCREVLYGWFAQRKQKKVYFESGNRASPGRLEEGTSEKRSRSLKRTVAAAQPELALGSCGKVAARLETRPMHDRQRPGKFALTSDKITLCQIVRLDWEEMADGV